MVWWTVCFSGNSCKGERSRHSRNGRKNREHGTIAIMVKKLPEWKQLHSLKQLQKRMVDTSSVLNCCGDITRVVKIV